jgi:hypothetical protein
MVTKNIDSINNEEHQRMMFDNVIPAIMAKWPNGGTGQIIFIQQDNAKPHSSEGDKVVESFSEELGWNIQMKRQPPNSPDFNVLDLGFFASIQSIQHLAAPTNIDELIEAVTTAFFSMKREKLDNVFLSLQQAMTGALMVNGDNTYKQSHMSKDQLRRAGLLPVSIQCDPSIIAAAWCHLDINNVV